MDKFAEIKTKFPFSNAVFEELAENIASIALIRPHSAAQFEAELNEMIIQLLKVSPTPQTDDVEEIIKRYSEAEIKEHLRACNVCSFLAFQLLNIAEQVRFSLALHQTGGAENDSKH